MSPPLREPVVSLMKPFFVPREPSSILVGYLQRAKAKPVKNAERKHRGGLTAPPAGSPQRQPDLLLAALERSGWSSAGAAKLLGYSPSTFSRRLGDDPELRAVTTLRIADMVREEREAKGDVEVAAKKLGGVSPALLARRLRRPR